MTPTEPSDDQFERFLDSLAKEVISVSNAKLTLLVGKNGTGKSCVLKRILERSVARGIKTLAVSFGVADRFPFSLAGPYEYIGTRSSPNAVHINSIDSKIFNAIVTHWNDTCFRIRLVQICELLEIPCDFMAHLTLRENYSAYEFTEFLMDSWARRAGAVRAGWQPLVAGGFYTEEQRNRFSVDLKKKFNVSIQDLALVISEIRRIINPFEPSNATARKWLSGNVPIDAISAMDKAGELIPALRFMGILRDFSLSIGRTLGADHLSSGQKNILFTLVQMSRHITPGSLILIDEPEISLHPDWQSRYLSFLNRVFGDISYNVVIATHSPFFAISEDAELAQIYSLRKTGKGHEWQRIESLSGVPVDVAAVDGFGVRYSSSPHLEQLLLRAVEELGRPAPDIQILTMLRERLTPLVRDPFDPLHVILEKLAKSGAK